MEVPFPQCNQICRSLGLTEFELSANEKKAISVTSSDSVSREGEGLLHMPRNAMHRTFLFSIFRLCSFIYVFGKYL